MTYGLAIWPDRAQYRPGQTVTLLAELSGPPHTTAELRVAVWERAEQRAELTASVTLDGAGRARTALQWLPPAGDGWRAYGADAAFAAATASTAFDVAPHWRYAPRYGFLADFAPGLSPAEDAARADQMLRLHLNVIQFYDWMYTHYDYVPPTEVFTDVLGRSVDFGAVRRRIDLCRRRGMAPLAYGSVYGAEKPLADQHPDWLLYDGTGRAMSLGNVFFIQDPSPECGWRQYLLGAYQSALDLSFAGIHCDTYGSPKVGLTHDGRVVRLDEALPGLMADAQALALAADPAEGGSMFNNVNGWPVETMAAAPGATLYIEVWPPDVEYRDLWELILRCRRLDRQRQTILSAYLAPFQRETERPAGAMAGLRLAAATIFASGGFHLLPGEGRGILATAYYPTYGRLDSADWEVVRDYWDFQTRYGPLLADPAAMDNTAANFEGDAMEVRLSGPEGVRFSGHGRAGTVWVILKETPAYRTVNLINLTAVEQPRWNGTQPEATPVSGITVRMECLRRPRAVWWASPDVAGGEAQTPQWRIAPDPDLGQVLAVTLPSLYYWDLLVIEE